MTAQTIAFLNLTLLATGQANDAITELRMRDINDTMKVRTPLYNVMTPEFGAVGDNAGHAASTRYGSLAACQAVYGTTLNGVTVALTMELDWLAHSLATQTAATNGGTVYSPASAQYVMSNASSAGDGSGQVLIPDGVSWVGDYGGTKLRWSSDIGTGKAAVLCANRASGASTGVIYGLQLNGPGNGSTLGSTTCNMQGIWTNDRRTIDSCVINAFRVGINVVGGQCLHDNIHITSCYYGYYWDSGNSGNFGNMNIRRVVIDSSLRAALTVHHAMNISNTTFWDCFFGTAPFGLFKETNSGAPGTSLLTSGCTFYNCQFEQLGNAMISDDRATPGARVVQLYRTRFVDAQFQWQSGFKIAALANFAAVDIAFAQMVSFEGIANPEAWTPGTQAIFSFQNNGGTKIDGDLFTIFANCVTAGIPCFQGNNWSFGYTELHHVGPSTAPWSGTTAFFNSGVTTNVVVFSSGANVANCAGTTTEVVAGVVQYVGSNSWGAVATAGSPIVKTSGTVTAGALVRTTTAGASLTSGTNVSFAVALTNAGTNTWNCALRGLN